MEEHKYNCIKLHYHRGYFEYFCGDGAISSCKYFELDKDDCRHLEGISRCGCKAAQRDAKEGIYDSIECDVIERASVHFRHSLDSNGQCWTEEDVSDLVKDDMDIDYPRVTFVGSKDE